MSGVSNKLMSGSSQQIFYSKHKNNSMHFWLDRGCPAKKLLVGIGKH